jgi:TIGR03118 family protein
VTSSFHFQTPPSVRTLHPFNIAALDGHLYVAYAMFDPAGDEGMEEQVGEGYGHLVEYNEDGTLVRDFKDTGKLNAPWGMAIAPSGFGKFGGALLVANLGDGTIAALDRHTGRFIDDMRDETGKIISIERIWGLVFGNGVSLGDAQSLYFTAGLKGESDGIFGRLTALPASVHR